MSNIKKIIIHGPNCVLIFEVGVIDNWVDKEVKDIHVFINRSKKPVYVEITYKKSKEKTTLYGFPIVIFE
ncbi:MAG: hypothetical protein WC438_06135 [Candidatus Pacearchaeota archaeon]